MASKIPATLIVSLALAGCATDPTPSAIPQTAPPRTAPLATNAPPPAMQPTPPATSSTIIGYSVQHRPIELRRFGDGERPVLIMGAIHGDETAAASVANTLALNLAHDPSIAKGVPVAVIPIANPDGYTAGTRVNAHHVDLNRNFPANNWTAHPHTVLRNNFGGPNAASEPETALLMQTIEALKPRLIISIHSMEKAQNNYDGPAQAIAELMSKHNGYPPTANIGYPTPGSLGNWAGVDRQIPMITLELPRSMPASGSWTRDRDALLAAIAAVAVVK